MPHVTLVMTRKPAEEKFYHAYSPRAGRMVPMSALFGRMAVVVGPKLTAANDANVPTQDPRKLVKAVENHAKFVVAMNHTIVKQPGTQVEQITLAGRAVSLVTDGTPLKVAHEFDTMERYRGDNGQFGASGFMMTRPRPDKPYELTYESGNTVVAKVNPEGKCLRVHGHGLVQQGGGAAGILIHEAPNVGWLIGCISPRYTSDGRDPSKSDTTRKAVYDIFTAMGGERKASLIVLDW